MNKPSIHIWSFVDEITTHAVQREINNNEFQCKTMTLQDKLPVDIHADLIMLVLGNRKPKQHYLTAFLQQNSRRYVMGVLAIEKYTWQQELIPYLRDFVNWPCYPEELNMRLKRMHISDTACNIKSTTDLLLELMNLNLVGVSRAFQDMVRLIKKMAYCDASVLIEGETGTGKEIAAQAIHYLSKRSSYPFVPVNCGALPDNLIGNELFGHEKGAYTDATDRQVGMVELARGGTLFLDEVEALSPKGQITLLRFLQNQEYRPFGAKHTHIADVRVIAASNIKLSHLVKIKQFRQDLFYRLNVFALNVPSLRERPEDLEFLTDHIIQRLNANHNGTSKKLHPHMRKWIKQYHWPGNIRELENVLYRNYVLSDGEYIHLIEPQEPVAQHVHINWQNAYEFDRGLKEIKSELIADFEQEYLCWLMQKSNGNVSLAAKFANKERSSIGKMLKKYNISYTDYKTQPHL